MNWHDLFTVIVAVIATRTHLWLKNKIRERREKLPWEYMCFACFEAGNTFYCSANEVAALDGMIIAHRTASHSGG
jgi:hypothetical protein